MKKSIVIEYKNPASLFDGTISYYGPVITAMEQTTDAYRKVGIYARSMKRTIKGLLPNWQDEKKELGRALLIRHYLANVQETKENQAALRAMRERVPDLLHAIRMLTEIGVRPEQVPQTPQEVEILANLYKKMIQDSQSGIQQFLRQTDAWVKDSDTFRKALQQAFGRIPQAVYFQGFYYITALQQRIIDAFCGLNIPVYFLNHIDRKRPRDFEIWRHNPFFDESLEYRGLPDEQEIEAPDVSRIRLRKYHDVFAMVRDFEKIKHEKTKTAFYAPMSTDIKELLETFFPDEADMDKKHILAYPVGRYLFTLYDMWDDDAGTIIFSDDKVRSALATGWAGKTVTAGKRLLMTYDRVQDYFRGCQTIKEWEDRACKLRKTTEAVLPIFKVPEGKAETERWRRIMNCPLEEIGAFSCSQNDLKTLLDALHQLGEDCHILFDNRHEVNLQRHFQRLSKMLRERASRSRLGKEEDAILHKVLHRLSWREEDIPSCPPGHLAQAMAFFLGGRKDEESEGAFDADQHAGIVRGISDIETAKILHPDERILLCCCDAQNMPGKEKQYPFPLTDAVFQEMHLQGKYALRMHGEENCRRRTRLANRYLFHIAQQIPGIEISWIEEQESGKPVNPSVYIQELALRHNISIEPVEGMLIEKAGETRLHQKTVIQPLHIPDGVPKEVPLDQMACRCGDWRLLYDYVLRERPVFQSDFHLHHFLTALTAVTASVMHISIEEAGKQIFALYPSLLPSEKSEILFFAQARENQIDAGNLTRRDNYEGKAYTQLRFYLQYLSQKNTEKLVKNQVEQSDEKEIIPCMWCPATAYCYVRRRQGNEEADI